MFKNTKKYQQIQTNTKKGLKQGPKKGQKIPLSFLIKLSIKESTIPWPKYKIKGPKYRISGPKKEQKNKLFIIVGFISGISSIFIGAVGPLIAPFFLRSDLNKENIIANKAACQIITHLGKIPIFMYFFELDYVAQYSTLLLSLIHIWRCRRAI